MLREVRISTTGLDFWRLSQKKKGGGKLTGARVSDGGVFDKASGNDGAITASSKRDAGESGAAWENISALGGTVQGAWNTVIVVVNDAVWKVKQGCTGVGDSVDGCRSKIALADGVTIAGEFPEVSTAVNGHVRNASSVLGVVDEAKAIASWRTLLQINSEDGG